MILNHPLMMLLGLVTALFGAVVLVSPLFFGAESAERVVFWLGLPIIVGGLLLMRAAVRAREATG